jgi:hypothetical protein
MLNQDPSTPNAAQLNEVHVSFERDTLAPYAAPGNILSMNMYDDLPLPWNIAKPATEFPQSLFVRHEYDRDGILSNGVSFFGGGSEHNLEEMEGLLGTASMVTRWRATHPDLAGTDKDVVNVHINEMRKVLPKHIKIFLTGASTAILLFKKPAN